MLVVCFNLGLILGVLADDAREGVIKVLLILIVHFRNN
jgi:hypothetical protein